MNANNEQTSIPKDEKQPKRTNVFAQPHFTSGKVAQPTQKAKARVSSKHQRDAIDILLPFWKEYMLKTACVTLDPVDLLKKTRLVILGSKVYNNDSEYGELAE